jgi:hypothetical protein
LTAKKYADLDVDVLKFAKFRSNEVKSKIGFRKLAGAVGLTAILAFVGPTQTIAGGKPAVPFAAALTGTAQWDGGPIMTCEGEGIAQHLGESMSQCIAELDFAGYAQYDECANDGTGYGIPNVNTMTLTAANGDQLVIVSIDLACEIVPFTSFHGTGDWTVDSLESTGRFAGATGTGRIDGNVDFSAGGAVMVTLIGEISY